MGRTSRIRLRARGPSFERVKSSAVAPVTRAAQRACLERGWAIHRAATLCEEFLRALYCKTRTFEDPMSLGVPPRLDAVWSKLVLETEDYAQVCRALGDKVAHTLDAAQPQQVAATLAHYEALWKTEPERWCWQAEQGTFRCTLLASGQEMRIPLSAARTVKELFSFCGSEWSVSVRSHNCIYAGNILAPGDLLDEAGIEEDSKVFITQQKPLESGVYVCKTLPGQQYRVPVERADTVAELLAECHRQGAPPPAACAFVYDGKCHPPAARLRDVGVRPGWSAILVDRR